MPLTVDCITEMKKKDKNERKTRLNNMRDNPEAVQTAWVFNKFFKSRKILLES